MRRRKFLGMQNVKMCIEAQNNDLNAIHINTVNRAPEEIVKEIIAKKLVINGLKTANLFPRLRIFDCIVESFVLLQRSDKVK